VGHLALTIDDDDHREAKALAARQGITFKEWVRRAVAAEVKRQLAEAETAERRRRRR